MVSVPPLRFDRGARRIALWGLTTISTVALLFSYKTSTSSSTAAETVAPATGTTTTAATPSRTSTSTYTGTVTGTAADTRWGPVQVRVTVASGKITAVDVVEEPDGNGRDREINADAVPTLVSETLQAQSTRIDMVSGATYTSEGYVTSLQSALDQAGLA
ncbi:FMN-binding protein [Actinomycetospora sp. NBRC 106378]|uniref:FMN-binding protein n=1 Tax=Actinomycetospora sp. NBRC 106378 TaxID=3032208 RepID=UPI0024A22DE8|nr:FMN-binding protein [Actinomycetospora sp. NBRC 106378]GLZ55582.1 FMN-binding protein [Actinomycetospora sp. NBRC 106378]